MKPSPSNSALIRDPITGELRLVRPEDRGREVIRAARLAPYRTALEALDRRLDASVERALRRRR